MTCGSSLGSHGLVGSLQGADDDPGSCDVLTTLLNAVRACWSDIIDIN